MMNKRTDLNRILSAGLAMLLSVTWQASQAAAGAADKPPHQSLERDGVVIDFEVLSGGGAANQSPMAGQYADIRFRVTDSAAGQPMSGLNPGAWLDQLHTESGLDSQQLDCKKRIGLYLKGSIGIRPLVDLNSYYLMILNKDPSITVIDPSISVGGVTSTLTRILLKSAPMDWVLSADEKRLFVSLPDADEVAVIDTDSFTLVRNIPAGADPMRMAMQPDGRYLWVGNDAADPAKGGVTVIDSESLQVVASIATGSGHHEMAFSPDSRYAFISNRKSGTLSIIDVPELRRIKDMPVGAHPLDVAYSELSGAVYVVDGQAGNVTVIDGQSHGVRSVIKGSPGLGPIGFSGDGRWGMALNTLDSQVLVIDAADAKVLHRIDVTAQPYQLEFTPGYAYIRGLGSSKVTMINLSSIAAETKPIVQGFDAGRAAPGLAGELPMAQSLATSVDQGSVFVVNPADNTTYFYNEGMNAPMSGYPNRGHTARAVSVLNRTLREVEPGIYQSRVRLPASGHFDVAFMLNQPELTHCFSMQVQSNPELDRLNAKPKVTLLADQARVSPDKYRPVRFQVSRGPDNAPHPGIEDLRVRYFMAPSSRPREVAATEVSAGLYEAMLELPDPGAYYLHVGSSSLGMAFGDQPYTSVRRTAATLKQAQ